MKESFMVGDTIHTPRSLAVVIHEVLAPDEACEKGYTTAGNHQPGQYAPTPEKEYDLGFGHLGNGLTVWNRAEEKDGDYVTVAHIGPDRGVTFYDGNLPESVRAQIEHEARTSNPTISATQDTPVFDTPPEGRVNQLD